MTVLLDRRTNCNVEVTYRPTFFKEEKKKISVCTQETVSLEQTASLQSLNVSPKNIYARSHSSYWHGSEGKAAAAALGTVNQRSLSRGEVDDNEEKNESY